MSEVNSGERQNTSSAGKKGSDGRVRVIREGVASYLPDIDNDETNEWIESFDGGNNDAVIDRLPSHA